MKAETLAVWMLRDEYGNWDFSFDEPSAYGRRYWTAKGRRMVLCRGKMPPDERAIPMRKSKRSGR
ncbi:MAG: hypothetical protein WC876_01955 [Candidatus Thermoplasmatota archaeon]|jgi:hypothetical protein